MGVEDYYSDYSTNEEENNGEEWDKIEKKNREDPITFYENMRSPRKIQYILYKDIYGVFKRYRVNDDVQSSQTHVRELIELSNNNNINMYDHTEHGLEFLVNNNFIKEIFQQHGGKQTRKAKKSKKSLIGKQDFGTWKNGSSVFKDKKGFYVVQWNPKKNEEYKKYLKNWKPKMTKNKLTLKNNKWTITKSKKKSKSKKVKQTNKQTKNKKN